MIPISSIDLALRIANSAIGVGYRIDKILLENALGRPLPFILPDAPEDLAPHIEPMEAFFQTDAGRAVLEAEKKIEEFDEYLRIALENTRPGASFARTRERFIRLYAAANGIVIQKMGDGVVPAPGAQVQLSIEHYIVTSAKPGQQRSVVVDIGLAVADVALEFVGANPGLITRNERVQEILTVFLDKFTAGNLEDLEYKALFQRTLSSVLSTALDQRELLDDIRPLGIVLEAIDRVRREDPNFVAGLVSGKGFDQLLQTMLKATGENLFLFSDNEILVGVLGGFLEEIASDDAFKTLIRGDKAALGSVAQVLIAQVARSPALTRDLDLGKPVWNSVLKTVLAQVQDRAQSRALFQGDTLVGLVHASLGVIAADEDLLADGFLGEFVVGLSETLQATPVTKWLTPASLRLLAQQGLDWAAANPDLIVRDHQFLQKMFAAVLTAGAKGFKDGFHVDLAWDLVATALESARNHVGLLEFPELYQTLIAGIITEFGRDDLKHLLAAQNLEEAIRRALDVVLANPQVWEKIGVSGDLGNVPAAALRSIAEAARRDPTSLLSGETLVLVMEGILNAVARRGESFARVEAGQLPELTRLLKETLKRLGGEIGLKVGSDNIVPVLIRMVLDWGGEKFLVDASDAAFKTRVSNVLAATT
jgi:hypothetical protein